MAKISVLYDFHEERIHPFNMIIRFKSSEDPWKRPRMFIPLQAPFRRFMSTDFTDDVCSAAVTLEHLILNPDKPDTFGIDVSGLKSRIDLPDSNYREIEQFIIRMNDIENVLQFDAHRIYEWEETT